SRKLHGHLLASDGGPARLRETLLPRLEPHETKRQSRECYALIGLPEDPRKSTKALSKVPPHLPLETMSSSNFQYEYGPVDLDHDGYEIEYSRGMKWLAFLARDEVLGVAELAPPAGEEGPDVVVDVAALPGDPVTGLLRVRVRYGPTHESITDPSFRASVLLR